MNKEKKLYNLIFVKPIKEEQDIDLLKEKLKKYFNNDAKIVEQLFKREQTVLKRNILKAEAEKYKSALEKIDAQCLVVESVANKKDKIPNIEKNTSIVNNLSDLEQATRHLVKVVSFNQRMIWTLLLLVFLSIVLWGTLYYNNPVRIIAFIDDNKAISNEFSLAFKTDDGEFSIPVKTYYPIRKVHLTNIKNALDEYYKVNKKYPVSSGNGKGFDGVNRGKGKNGKHWIEGLVPEFLSSLPKDPRRSKNPGWQYIYRSNGKDFKLIANAVKDKTFVSFIDPSFIDPNKKRNAYGFWTKNARNW